MKSGTASDSGACPRSLTVHAARSERLVLDYEVPMSIMSQRVT
jgi:hypothetical protein